MTMTTKSFVIALLVCLLLESHNAASAFVQQRTIESTSRLTAAVSNDNNDGLSSSSSSSSSSADNIKRRSMMQMAILTAATVGMPTTSNAAGTKSRSDGYNVQKTDDEWKTTLTTRQYDILRNGGTERQYSSILEGEERDGTYNCAGCKTPLFLSKEKFHSGTGWPSFASALDGVEIEKKNMLAASLGGSEVRCRNCGGHLGDLFKDGYIFVGTPAAETGKRFCIDGVALNFKSNIDGTEVIGDEVPSRVQYYYN